MCSQETTPEAAFYNLRQGIFVILHKAAADDKTHLDTKKPPTFWSSVCLPLIFLLSIALFLSEYSIFVILVAGLSVLHGANFQKKKKNA